MVTYKNVEECFIGVTMIAVVLLLTVNIILRFFFSAGITWAEEFIRYAIIWITFIGGAICFRKGIHVGIDLFIDVLPQKGKTILSVVINVLAIILMILFIKYGIDLVIFSMNMGQLTPALQIKMYWAYLAIPVGSFLSLVHLLINTFGMIRQPKSNAS